MRKIKTEGEIGKAMEIISPRNSNFNETGDVKFACSEVDVSFTYNEFVFLHLFLFVYMLLRSLCIIIVFAQY